MAAGLGALRDDDVGARGLGLLSVADPAAHDDDLHVSLVHLVDELSRDGEAGDERAHVLVEDDLHLRADHVGDRREQVDGEGLVGQIARLPDLRSQLVRAHRRGADDAEPAGVRDGGDERRRRDAAHAREEDRILDTEEVADGRVEWIVHVCWGRPVPPVPHGIIRQS